MKRNTSKILLTVNLCMITLLLVLNYGTPEECVAYTKRLCDELGKDDLHDIGKNIGADEWAHSPQKTVATCKAWAE